MLISLCTLYAEDSKKDYHKLLTKDCGKYYTPKCLKLDVVSWLEKLNENGSYSVYPGISIVRENGSAPSNTADIVAVLARDFPNDPDSRLDAFLVKKVHDFFNSHSIKLELTKKDTVATARKKGGGGGGGGGGVLALGAMMASSVGALALAGLAAIAGKALMTALISLLLSALAGLKGGGGGKTTYEVISKPVHTYSSSHSTGHEDYHGGGGHGYQRSIDNVELPLGLQANYKPE